MFWSYSFPTLVPNPFPIHPSLPTGLFNYASMEFKFGKNKVGLPLPILSLPSLVTKSKGAGEEAAYQT